MPEDLQEKVQMEIYDRRIPGYNPSSPLTVLKVSFHIMIKGSKCHMKTLLSCSFCVGDRNTILSLLERKSDLVNHLAEGGD